VVFEFVFFMVSVLSLLVWLIGRTLFQDWQQRRRGRQWDRLVRWLIHKDLARAQSLFGAPDESFPGSDGRRLYVWKGPEQPGVPRSPRLLIITVTTGAGGVIERAVWEER
jgi:hypothetical protein